MKHPWALMALLVGAVLLGFAGIFTRWAAPAGPFAIGFFRMALALPGVLLLAWWNGGPFPGFRASAWAWLAGTCFVIDLSLWHTAMTRTSVASATLLVGLAPLWVALGMTLFGGLRLTGRAWLGLALSLSGAAMLGWAAKARLGGGWGELLSLGASFAYAAYTITLSRSRQCISSMWALAGVVASATLGFGVMALLQGQMTVALPVKAWLSLLGLGLLVQTLAWWMITWSLGHLPANLGSLGLLGQQVATVLLGWMLLGERPSSAQWLGTLCIISGIGLTATTPPRSRAVKP